MPVFFGQLIELEKLERWITINCCLCEAIVGMRGMGKTQLSLRLRLGRINNADLSLQLVKGIQEQFEFVIWRSLINAPPLFEPLSDLIKVVSQEQIVLPERVGDRISYLM